MPTSSKKTEGRDIIEEALGTVPQERLVEMAKTVVHLKKSLRKAGPKTDDELWQWVKDELGIEIARVSVCEGHDAPFDFLAAAYFDRFPAILVMANRGGGKTFLVALLHWINSEFKPGIESATFGATEAQSLRCYAHLKTWIYNDDGDRQETIKGSVMRETNWYNRSKVEVLAGCLPGHAKVQTPEGNVRISEIVSRKLKGPVRSWDYNKEEWVWSEITGWHNNGKGTDWLKMSVEVSTLQSKSDLYCTGGHRLMLPDGSKQHAAEFEVGDELCVVGDRFSSEQEQVFIGTMLGDAHVTKMGMLRLDHCERQESYLDWKINAFSEFEPRKNRREAKNTCSADFRVIRETKQARLDWYPKGKKIIPKDIWEKMTPLSLAVWLMDDGYFARRRMGHDGGVWEISALHSDEGERKDATCYFDSLGIDGDWIPYNLEKDQWLWRSTAESALAIQALVGDYIDIGVRQPIGWKRWVASPVEEHSHEDLLTTRITSIEPVGTEQSRYDISVPPHANYLISSGILVSNTPEAVNGPHPQVVHGDEVELMREDTWAESQPVSTMIPTPTGLRRMGDLELGDEVLGRDGRPTRVTKIFELGEREVFDVKFTDGRSTQCCDDHLWFVAGKSQKDRGVWKVKRLSEIREKPLKLSSSYGNFVPQASPVDFPEVELPIDPYTLGVVLGDGFIGRTSVDFRAVDGEIVERVKRLSGWEVTSADDGGYEKHRLKRVDKKAIAPLTAFSQVGLAGRRSGDKFIPAIFLTASAEQRLELLRGLMDTDGCAIEGSSVGQYATISEQLADDLRSLVFSLGGRAIKRSKQFTTSWSNGTLYTLDISFGDETEIFALARKQEKMELRQRTLDPSIREIESAGIQECRCIGVDNEDESYLTTDYIVTHNSRNMAVSKTLPDGTVYPSLELLTSTRKSQHGRMQKLIDGIDEAKRMGMEPSYELIAWCIFEVAKEVPNCQKAPDKERKARLKELGMDPSSICDCHKQMNGTWPDQTTSEGLPKPRLLTDVCQGRLFRSRGHLPISDVIQKFKQNSIYTWNAQMECSEPETENNYLRGFTAERNGVLGFVPDPANGPIYQSVDWGGCYDGETDVLTDRGWVPFPEITEDDQFASLDIESHKVIFQKPEAVLKKEYGGAMERYENRSVDLLVSSDHNMLVAPLRGSEKDQWGIVRSDSIGERGDGLRVTRTSRGREDAAYEPFILPGLTAADGRVLPDVEIEPRDWAAFMGFWMAEGHTHLGKNNQGERRQSGDVGFTHYDRSNIEQIKEIAGRYFRVLDRVDYEARRGQLKICDPRLYSYLSQFGKAGDKFLPDDVKRWDSSLLAIYLDWHMRGDGDGRRIYTGSERLADDLQEILMYSGKAATISRRDPRDGAIEGRAIKARLPQFAVSVVEKRLEPQISAKPLQDPVKRSVAPQEWNMGKVYCVHLPEHHTLYVRRNGKPVWSGNTNPHAVNWYQRLKFEIAAQDFAGNDIRLPENALVCFDEIYTAEVGAVALANLVKKRERHWKMRFPGWEIEQRFADPQGKTSRLDWKDEGLITKWFTTRDFDEQMDKILPEIYDADLVFVSIERCSMFIAEALTWQRDPNTGKQIDKFNHCVTGDTTVQTNEGLRIAADLDGEVVEVLTQGGEYREAKWRSYGEREVFEVEFDNGEVIRATDGHEWVVQGEKKKMKTLNLVGKRIPLQPAKNWRIDDAVLYNEGVKNGLIYGDGTVGHIKRPNKTYSYSWMHQYGEENCDLVEDYFPDRHGERRESPHGVKVSTKMMPPELKRMCLSTDLDYVRGFLAGLIAADGSVNKQGCAYIATSKREDVDRLVDLCRTVGIVVANVEEREPGPDSYPNAKNGFKIWMTKGSLDETILLKPSHRENGLRKKKWEKTFTRLVVAVRSAGKEEVFCCEEPVTNTWVTGSGFITSNCMSNFRYAAANILALERRSRRRNGGGGKPTVNKSRHQTTTVVRDTRRKMSRGPVKVSGGDSDNWRNRLGAPGGSPMRRSDF